MLSKKRMEKTMKKNLVKTIACLLLAATLIPLLLSCSASDKNKTTTTNSKDAEPARDTVTLLANSKYAKDGLEYTLQMCKDYYNTKSHTIKRSLTNQNAAEIWYAAAYIETLTEAYKLYPENAEIKKYYKYALDQALPQYRVDNARIKTPTKSYTGMTYYNAGRKSSGDFYFDDNAWVCWVLFEAYELLGDKKYLNQAEDVLEFLLAGKRDKGGIYWSKDFGGIGTCATAPTICCLLRGYQATEKVKYLEEAIALYDFIHTSSIYDKGTGRYFAGEGDPWQPSYDQGTMILSSCMLYEITGEEQYYKNAKKTANACLSHSFDIEGTRKDYTVKIRENPYYCSWAFSWLVRGIIKYIDVTEKKSEAFMTYLKSLIDSRDGTKNEKGYYDHYFGTASKGWLDTATDTSKMFDNDHVVLMPSGYGTMLLLTGYFDVYVSKEVLEQTAQ